MHLNTELLFEKYAIPYFKDGMKVLEIGGAGITNFCKIVNNNTITWDTLDIDLSKDEPAFEKNHIISNKEYSYPLAENTYDIILSGNVIEHVKKIWTWTKELHRIVQKGGHVITINPISWPFHEAPVDCWRIYPEGARALFEDAGFIVRHTSFECLELEYFKCKAAYILFPGFTIGNSSLANFTSTNVSLNRTEYRLSSTNKLRILYNRLLKNIPFVRRMMVPLKISYDTVTIAQKASS